MPEDTQYDEYGNPIEQDVSATIKEIRQAQKEADKRAREAEGRARSAELKVAMAEAGVTLNPQTKFFLSHYEGETDVESVKAGLAEHGFVETQSPEDKEAEENARKEAEQQEKISGAAQGGGEPPAPSDEPWNDELRVLKESMTASSDPHVVQAKAEAIMRKYNQPVYNG